MVNIVSLAGRGQSYVAMKNGTYELSRLFTGYGSKNDKRPLSLVRPGILAEDGA